MPMQNGQYISMSQFLAQDNTVTPVNGDSWFNVGTLEASLNAKRPRTKKAVAIDPGVPMVLKSGFKIGCDPEMFVFKGKKPVPACEAGVPGCKEDPYPVLGGAIQVDGMAAEINTEPAETFEDWNTNLETVISQLQSLLPKGHRLEFAPSVRFEDKIFDAAPDECKALGCTPDIDAYTGNINPPPEPADPYVRCAGGHIHVSWTEGEDVTELQHMLNCQDLVKQLDWLLGIWSLKHDNDAVRRGLYGKAGACRYKHYGVEYRVLSNFWLKSKELRLELWNRLCVAIDTMSNIYLPERMPSSLRDLLVTSINSSTIDPQLISHAEYPINTYNTGMNRW